GAPIARPAEVVADQDLAAEAGREHVANEGEAARLGTVFRLAEAVVADIGAEPGDPLVLAEIGITVHVAEGNAVRFHAELDQIACLLIAHRAGGRVGDDRAARFPVRGSRDADELAADLAEIVVLGPTFDDAGLDRRAVDT